MLKIRFLPLQFWVTDLFSVAIPTLDSREAPYSGPFCEEKQRPGVEGANNMRKFQGVECLNGLFQGV